MSARLQLRGKESQVVRLEGLDAKTHPLAVYRQPSSNTDPDFDFDFESHLNNFSKLYVDTEILVFQKSKFRGSTACTST
jgi:hypothetical protein